MSSNSLRCWSSSRRETRGDGELYETHTGWYLILWTSLNVLFSSLKPRPRAIHFPLSLSLCAQWPPRQPRKMPFGLKKKASRSAKSNTAPSSPTRESPPLPVPNRSFRYGASVSKTKVNVGGLPVNVFGLEQLTPRPSRASAPPPPPVCVFIHLHGRGGSADNEEQLVRHLYDSATRQDLERPAKRDCLAISFDARNHGHRVTNSLGQQGWKQGNAKHAMDLYAMMLGTANDASFIIDMLSSYLFPHDERRVEPWVVSGKSLGGHATWHCLANDPRVHIGLPFIGMPDYTALLHDRTRSSFVPNAPPTVPASLKSLITRVDPARRGYDSWDPQANPFLGKKICVCSGADDPLVKWNWNQPFLDALVLGEPDARGNMPGLDVYLQPGVRHEVTDPMIEYAGAFLRKWAITVDSIY